MLSSCGARAATAGLAGAALENLAHVQPRSPPALTPPHVPELSRAVQTRWEERGAPGSFHRGTLVAPGSLRSGSHGRALRGLGESSVPPLWLQ